MQQRLQEALGIHESKYLILPGESICKGGGPPRHQSCPLFRGLTQLGLKGPGFLIRLHCFLLALRALLCILLTWASFSSK